MGKSASSSSKDSDSFRKASGMLKDASAHIIVGFSKKQGEFEFDPSLKRYMDAQVKVVRVTRYLDPMKAKGYGLGHEFLAVDLRTPQDCQLVIKAEKQFIGFNHEKYRPGGLTCVTRIEDPPGFAIDNEGGVRYTVGFKVDVKILMKDLIDILEAREARRYSLWKHNCWKYAYDTMKNLLEKFAGLADSSDDFKKEIQEELLKMPRPSLPAEILVEGVGVLLGLASVGALIYVGALGGIAAFKYLGGLKMAQAAGATVKGLAGSSLFKASVAAASSSLAKRSWVRGCILASCGLGTGGFLVHEFEVMRQKHSVRKNS